MAGPPVNGKWKPGGSRSEHGGSVPLYSLSAALLLFVRAGVLLVVAVVLGSVASWLYTRFRRPAWPGGDPVSIAFLGSVHAFYLLVASAIVVAELW